ncbi:MAG: CDP-alcohol phosphatidyltransferase family protein [SAR324 cluster bacterium]|nr:CDP-alcohol phosphatidyltransferase family protein [SAR324 cluster bacterium]
MLDLETIPPVIYQSILPILLLFCIERITLFSLSRISGGRAWVRSKFWLRPNFISRCRYPMGVVSVLLYHTGTWLHPLNPTNGWHHAGVLYFAFWMISDITDGTIARLFQLGSEEGESIDPLSDKLLLFPPLLYFAYFDLIPMYLVLIFLLFDIIGTLSRFFIVNKAANLFGKAKMFLGTLTLVLVAQQQIYYPGEIWNITFAMLVCSVFLSFCSMFLKVIPNYWYANLLSIMNLICGLIGIALVIMFNQIGFAFALVFLGQFLDLFDGRAADRWGSTPKGELLDDLADGANFGGTISLIIMAAFHYSMMGIFLGLFHFVCTIYRLYRFIVNKRKDGVEGGVKVFSGLPSPAAALISGSVALIQTSNVLKSGCIMLVSFLMISRLPYIHFGRVVLPAIPKLIQVILLTLIMLAVWAGFRPGYIQILYWTVFLISFSYLVLGYNWKRDQVVLEKGE